MYDFLSFNTFITQDVLLFFYYVGAVVVPFLLYNYKNKFITSSNFFTKLESNPRFFLISVGTFLLLELFWRMMFEAMIGYFDMHEYLYEISTHLQQTPLQ